MVSKDFDNDDKLQEKINSLTSRLEQELDNLRTAHTKQLNDLRETCNKGIESLNENFSNQCQQFNTEHLQRTLELEEQIKYLKELNDSQRLMMLDQIAYIRELEAQASQLTGNSGKAM